ncbi:MAG: hypothetical protein IKC77_03525 [Lentisphaeria bacterium]|nr:hypothetical protein [Lentisphaeria bacterium]
MKRYFIFTCAAVFFLFCGCSSVRHEELDTTAPQKFSSADVESGKILAENYINALVQAVKSDDFNVIAPYLQTDMFSMRHKKTVFHDMCKRFSLNGKIISHSFVGVFDQTLCKDYIWKIDFEKNTGSEKLPVIRTTMLYIVRIVMGEKAPEIVRARPIQL